MIALRFLIGFIIPLTIIIIPIFAIIAISGRKNRIDRVEYIMAVLSCFLFGLFGPILATTISSYGLSYGREPNDPLCVTGAGIFIFFGYLITIIGVPITGIVRYPPETKTS